MTLSKITALTPNISAFELELLASHLFDLGANGIEFGGSNLDELIPAPVPGLELELDSAPPEAASVTVYTPDSHAQGVGIIAEISAFLESRGFEYTVEQVDEQDWENNWKEYFLPFTVGENLLIKPSWIPAEDVDNPTGRIVLEIDPASAFGTGQHASTRMCLELLESHIKGGENVLDIGSGSGILSAAAGLLGARHLTAVDVCENAVRITKETLDVNGLQCRGYDVRCGNLITDESFRHGLAVYDIVVANITADVITAMAGILPRFAGGTLILSGIIEPRLPEVVTALEEYFTLTEIRKQEDWVAVVCVKR